MADILLMGGSSFIGRNIIEQLARRHNIISPGRTELDVLDAEAVKRFIKAHDFKVVIHAVNVGGNRRNPGPPNMVELNLRMFFNTVRCKDYFGKMIYFGSGAEYGKQAAICQVREEDFDVRMPVDPYGFYKYTCAKYTEKIDNIICLRLFGCYGKYEDYEFRFISNAICKTVFGMPITLNNKNVMFSYLYVDDLIRVVDHFISHEGSHKIYNVTPDERVDLLTIAKIIQELSDGETKIESRVSGVGPEYSGDNARLKSEITGLEFTAIKDGINRLYSWYKENKHTIDKGKLYFSG